MAVIVLATLLGGIASDMPYLKSVASGDTTQVSVPADAGNLERFIANHEGFSASAYHSVDYWNWTIGYGHVITAGDGLSPTSTITTAQGLQLMDSDLAAFEPYVEKEFTGYALTIPQRDAMLDFAYGEGTVPFTDHWSIFDDAKGYLTGTVTADQMEDDFLNYTMAGGQEGVLFHRRIDEWKLFCDGDYGFASTTEQ